MNTGTLVTIIMGAAMVSIGAIMGLRSGKPFWWIAAVFGILLLGASALMSYVSTL
ncbi:MAG: hypothetical protein J0J04_08210 [Microbacterium sp.]|uniref:hypothetical protein n=1 Tax=Microbacterium sp. TaxID=51671 RepID=UPI001AC3EA3E|nr:hypothetical protein [Microbacterium sp.]MBN9214784.1 hypothetical protein [Microbacterium sp.]